MSLKPLSAYMEFLHGCRFCPMCKPAAEVANVTLVESYSTRARAMMLWRVARGVADFTPRDIELLYQSTLDSISQAWCVNHYTVSEYVLAARAEVFKRSLMPQPVQRAFRRFSYQGGELRGDLLEGDSQAGNVQKGDLPVGDLLKGDVVLLASEAAELGKSGVLEPALQVLEKIGLKAETAFLPSGAVAYSLGGMEHSIRQAGRVAGVIKSSGARRVIADGPSTLWALKKIFPVLDVKLPSEVTVTSLSELIAGALKEGRLGSVTYRGKKVLLHDARGSCLLADEMANYRAIQPGFQGPEELLGKGDVYSAPRSVADDLGMERVFSVWSRSLCKSCGADDGLWVTYPDLAGELAGQRLREAEELGACAIITDSLLCAQHLRRAAPSERLSVLWIPELFSSVAGLVQEGKRR